MHLRARSRVHVFLSALLLGAMAMAATPAASAPLPAPAGAADIAGIGGTVRDPGPLAATAPTTAPRRAVPEDRYAMAGGCYTLRSAATGRYVNRTDGSPAAGAAGSSKAAPFRFQATALGRYLLYGTARDFLATTQGAVGKGAEAVGDNSVAAAVDGVAGERITDNANKLARSEGPTTGRGAAIIFDEEPSGLADWVVVQTSPSTFRFSLPSTDGALVATRNGSLDLAPAASAGKAALFRLALAKGCPAYPEVQVNVTGPIARGATPYAQVRGYVDAHLHSMAFEFLGGRARCGRPWHPYGAPYALRGCKEHEIAGGRAAVLENFLANRDPVKGHDTNAGWPSFTDWPKPESLTYEQVYYKWLERAWRGGLRSYVNLLVDNNQLCKVYPYKKHGCNEMDGVRLQYKRIHQFQNYIDAQSGGPGEGWFRIVDDPFEARRVMNAGKLAVIMGIEVSVLFDCGVKFGQPECTKEQVDQRLDEVYAMGVRQMELVNKFDNALSGVTGDSAAFGALVNNANFLETGSYWPMRTCKDPETHAHDKQQYNVHDESGAPEDFSGRDSLVGVLLNEVGGSGRAPLYGPGPHCSELGLSPLGAHLIGRLMDKGMIFDPDHMSAKARDQALDLLEARQYSGVISSHSWADDTIYPRIWKLGGVVTPHAGTSASFVEKWRKQKAWADDRYLFGLGFGSDMNGFSNQGQPRGANAPRPVKYPFTALGGAVVHKQRSGTKTYDFNVDGVAHYGMYADFVEDVRRLGGDAPVADMQRAAEAYLQMWERAAGVGANSCRADVPDLKVSQVQQLRSGMTPEEVLIALGQPAAREEVTFTFCVEGAAATATFGPDGGLVDVKRVRQPTASRPAASAGAAAKGAGTAKAAPPAPRPAGAAAAVKGATGGAARHDHATHAHKEVDTVATASRGDAVRPVVLLLFLALGVVLVLRRRVS